MKGNEKPRPGDVTVCIGCAAVLHFKNDMTVAKLPSLDLLGDEHRIEVEKLVRAIRQMHGLKAKEKR